MEYVRLINSSGSADSHCFLVWRNYSVCGAGFNDVTMLIVRSFVKFHVVMQNVERDFMHSIG
jgi:hypothetical protein